MYIKIYTKSQLVLLRKLEPFLKKKYRLPKEILNRINMVLQTEDLGKSGFVAVILTPISDDLAEIQDILDCYPCKLNSDENIMNVSVPKDKRWLTKDRDWYMDELKLKNDGSSVYVIYSVRLKLVYAD